MFCFLSRNLKGLKISNMTGVDNKELVTILMEEMMPNCHLIGVDYTSKEHGDSKSEPEKGKQTLDSTETNIAMDRPSSP